MTESRPTSGHADEFLVRNASDLETATGVAFPSVRFHAHSARLAGVCRTMTVGEISVIELSANDYSATNDAAAGRERSGGAQLVVLQVSGRTTVTQAGRALELGPGSLTVCDLASPFTLDTGDGSATAFIAVPQQALESTAEAVAALVGTDLARGESASGYVPALNALIRLLPQADLMPATQITYAIVHLIDALLLGARSAPEADAADSELMRSIRAYIEANLANPALDPRAIAEAHFISTRLLHQLFRAHGTSVSAWILSRRLDHCWQDLINPLHSGVPISSISARWGFTSAGHFSRLFKSVYRETPSGLRRARSLTDSPAGSRSPTHDYSLPPAYWRLGMGRREYEALLLLQQRNPK